MTTHSGTLAWKIPWMEEPGGLQSMWSLRVRHDWAASLSLSCIGEGNGNPLQCSCLENPRDWGTWWAAVYGVAQSRTRLKRRSSSSREVMIMPRLIGCIERPLAKRWGRGEAYDDVWVWISVLLFTSCVIWRKLFNLSKSKFPQRNKWDNLAKLSNNWLASTFAHILWLWWWLWH